MAATFSVWPDYVMPNSWRDSRHITDDSICYSYSCHKILLCLHGSLVHQSFHLPREMEIQWYQVRGARGPGYWASTSNPSVAKGVIQVGMYNMAEKMKQYHGKQSVINEYDLCHLSRSLCWFVYLQSPPPFSESLASNKFLNNFNLHFLLYSFPSLFDLNCLCPPPHSRDSNT